MEHKIEVDGKEYTMSYRDMDDNIDIERDISIDYSNLAGDAYVTQLISNTVGMMKADLEKEVKMKELEIQIFESDFRLNLRKESANNNGYCKIVDKHGDKIEIKLTEKALELKPHASNRDWQKLKNELYIKQNYLSKVESFYWKIQDKIERLKLYIKEITPEEFEQELIDKALSNYVKKQSGLH